MSIQESRFKNLKEAALHLGVSKNTLKKWSDEDSAFPRPFRMGRLVKFKTTELDAWLDEQRVDSLDPPANWHYPNKFKKNAKPAAASVSETVNE
jgi:excisionase family DNA binding protein